MRRLITVSLGVLILAACNSSPGAPATSPTPTHVPVSPASENTAVPARPPITLPAQPPEMPPTDEPLATLQPSSPTQLDGLEDDFNDPKSGWDVNSSKEGRVGYEDGGYVIQVDKTEYSLWANPGGVFDDVAITVQAQSLVETVPSDMGIICRYENVANFMYGAITSDGYYGISQMKDGDLSVLSNNGKLRSSEVIQQGAQPNAIQFQCAGNQFTLIVNNQALATIEADAPTTGDVGLLAGTFEQPGARVRFDDFAATTGVSAAPRTGGTILLADDFSHISSGWDVRKTDNGASGYRDGRYFIRIESPKYQLWSTTGQDFADDVVVDVTAQAVAGPQKNEMGVVCRYRDIDNFVYGSVGSDGYYAIVEVADNKTNILTGNGQFQQSDAIPVGSETYALQLACEGDRYTLFVNDQEIDSALSSTFSHGDVGLLAGTFDKGGVEIVFDDFRVSKR